MNNDVLSQLNQQQQNMQNASNNIINNPLVNQSQPSPQSSGNVGVQDVTGQLPGASTDTIKPVTDQNQPNWLEKLIPTAGGVLGSIGGALIPGLGETGIGEAAGGAAGSAAGQALEDLLTGKQIGSDVASAGLEGGIGGIGGKVLGAGIKGAGGLLAGTGEKAIQNVAEQKAAQEAVNTAQETRNTWAGVKPSFLKANDLAGTQDLAKEIGVNPNSPQELSQTGTAANDILNSTLNSVLAKNGGVDTTGLNDIFKNAIGKNAGTLGGTDAVALSRGRMGLPNTPGSQLYQQLQNLSAGISNRAEADPTELRALIGKVGALAADAKPGISATTGAIDPTQKAIYNTLNDVYGQLKNTLYNRPELSKDISSLTGGIQAEDVGGNQTLADHINEAISNAQSPQDLLDELSKFTNMSKLGNAGMEAANNPATAAAVNAAKQEAGQGAATYDAQGNPIANVASQVKHPIVSAVGHALNFAGNGGRGSEAAIGLGGLLKKMAPVLGAAGAQTVANAPNMTGPAGANTAVGNGLVLPEQKNAGDVSTLLQSVNPAAKTLGLDLLYAEHRMPGQETTGLTPADLQEANALNKVSAARGQIANLINMLNQSGGAQGPIGGGLSKLGAMITGGPAAQYSTQAKQLTDSINSLLGTNIQTPDITMNQQSANDVLAQLSQALQANGV